MRSLLDRLNVSNDFPEKKHSHFQHLAQHEKGKSLIEEGSWDTGGSVRDESTEKTGGFRV